MNIMEGISARAGNTTEQRAQGYRALVAVDRRGAPGRGRGPPGARTLRGHGGGHGYDAITVAREWTPTSSFSMWACRHRRVGSMQATAHLLRRLRGDAHRAGHRNGHRLGLGVGADDYVTKPFSPLVAPVRVLRRPREAQGAAPVERCRRRALARCVSRWPHERYSSTMSQFC